MKAGAGRDLQRSLVAYVCIELKTNKSPVRKAPTGRENERPGCDPSPTMRSSDPIADVGRGVVRVALAGADRAEELFGLGSGDRELG